MESAPAFEFENVPFRTFKSLGHKLVEKKAHCVGYSTNPSFGTLAGHTTGVTLFQLGAEMVKVGMGS